MASKEILYLCDHKKNVKCKIVGCAYKNNPFKNCKHTHYLQFAKNYTIEPSQQQLEKNFELKRKWGCCCCETPYYSYWEKDNGS